MSAAPAKTSDPSMEEILASIRRIIADDDDKSPTTEAKETDASQEATAEAPGATTAAASPATSQDEQEDRDDVLDLGMDDRAKPDTSLEIDLPDLSFQASEDEERWDAPPAKPEPPAPPVERTPSVSPLAPPRAPHTTSAFSDASRPRPPAPTASEPRPAPPRRDAPAAGPDAMLSHETSASVGQAFNLLSHTMMSQNPHTLEDIVREMLKPMLKTWLDDNLPPLVERLVAAEIQRVARGQRG